MQANKRHIYRRRNRTWLLVSGGITLLIMIFIFMMSAEDAEESSRLSKGFLTTLIGSFLGRFLPQLSQNGLEYDIRKYAHMFEYFCLAISSTFFFLEYHLQKRYRFFAAGISVLSLCFLYACTDEWHQTFVSGRYGCFSDVLVDSAGSMIGLVLVLAVGTILQAKRNKKDPLSEDSNGLE